MTDITSEDIFLGRKQEDFDLAEKLLVKHGKLSIKCVREMADAVYGRMGIAECHKILKRVWNDMYVRKLEDENDKLREALCNLWRFTKSACKKYPKLFDQSAQGGQMVQLNAIDAFEQSLRELGIEVE